MSDVDGERGGRGGRWGDMRARLGNTRMTVHSTGVAAGFPEAVTLGNVLFQALRRPREISAAGLRRSGRFFWRSTGDPLHRVTSSHVVISPGSGAVALAVMKLTCSAISNPGRQGGEKPMSLAPEVR